MRKGILLIMVGCLSGLGMLMIISPKVTLAALTCSKTSGGTAQCVNCGSAADYGECSCETDDSGSCAGCGHRCGGTPQVINTCTSSNEKDCDRQCDSNCTSATPSARVYSYHGYTYTEDTYTTCSDYNADIGTYNGCKTPANTNTAFWDSPQYLNGDTTQTCGGMSGGGGCGDSTGCGGLTCRNQDTAAQNNSTGTCRMARDGQPQCGGSGACNDAHCGTAYTNPLYWGTNAGKNQLGFTTTASGLGSDKYELCKLQTPGDAVAKEVCNITGVSQIGNAQLACRCGEDDVCDLQAASTDDLTAAPADLRIASFNLQNEVGSMGHINAWAKQRFEVQFALADKYNSMSQDAVDKAVLYTRLIEICPINTQDDWTVPADPTSGTYAGQQHWCVLVRVDGDLSKITQKMTVNIPNFVISYNSEGPWTLRYRTINDVCNRRFQDPGPDSGQFIYCQQGKCIDETRQTPDSVTGKFYGTVSRGNSEINADTTSTFNYCNTQIDPAVNAAAYSNANSRLIITPR